MRANAGRATQRLGDGGLRGSIGAALLPASLGAALQRVTQQEHRWSSGSASAVQCEDHIALLLLPIMMTTRALPNQKHVSSKFQGHATQRTSSKTMFLFAEGQLGRRRASPPSLLQRPS